MKPRFNIDDYKKYGTDNYSFSEPRVCMCCESKEESDKFREYMDSVGLTWASGHKYTDLDYWHCYTDKIFYFFKMGTVAGSVKFYDNTIKSGALCLNYSDFNWGDKNSCKFMEKKNETKIQY